MKRTIALRDHTFWIEGKPRFLYAGELQTIHIIGPARVKIPSPPTFHQNFINSIDEVLNAF